MDTAIEHSKQRKSRWDREPVLSDDGQPKTARLTERDIEIFKLLARYTFLPLDDIHAFVGGSLKGLSQHISLLSRKPNLYVRRPPQQRNSADANYRHLIYQLDDKGAAILRELGFLTVAKRTHRNFAHELMACRIMASIELGTRGASGIRLITWPEIMASKSIPLATKTSPTPTAIPVSIILRGERQSVNVMADATPFGIERKQQSGGKLFFFFPGIEADCGTEPIEPSGFDRSSIYRKFIAYREIAAQGVHRSRFGFPNLFVPIITTSTARMQSMMALLHKLTDGRGSKMFLFKTYPKVASGAPTGHMLTEPWLRAGFEPLSLTA